MTTIVEEREIYKPYYGYREGNMNQKRNYNNNYFRKNYRNIKNNGTASRNVAVKKQQALQNQIKQLQSQVKKQKYLNASLIKATAAGNRQKQQQRKRKVVSPYMQKFFVNTNTQQWLNAVTNPFGTMGSKVPDDFSGETVMFKDGNTMIDVVVNADFEISVDIGVSACVFFLIPGYASSNTYYSSTQVLNGDVDTPYYHVGVMMVDTNGICIGAQNGVGPFYNTYAPQNEVDLFNVVANSNSMANALRLVSAAFRVWPQVEVQTSSDQLAVYSYTGATMNLANFMNSYVSGQSSLTSGLIDPLSLKTYSNTTGITVRLNPLQGANFKPVLNMKSQSGWTLDSNNLDTINIPIVLVQFNQTLVPVQISDSANRYTLPIYFESTYWLEGILAQPSPVIGKASPVDSGFDEACDAVLANKDIFPEITEGHSFKKFTSQMGIFASKAGRFVNNASRFGTSLGRGLEAFSTQMQ